MIFRSLKYTALIVLLFLASVDKSVAQDGQFAQFFAAPMYSNPAFAGTAGGGRFVFNSRTQWTSLPNHFKSNSISYDALYPASKTGVGFMAHSDQWGLLRSNSANAILSQGVDFKNDMYLRLGVNFGIQQRDLNFSQLVFEDQINPALSNGTGRTEDPVANTGGRKTFVDLGVGALFYSKTGYLSVGVAHANQPNQAFKEVPEQILPARFTVQGGYRIYFSNPEYKAIVKTQDRASLNPSVQYRYQNGFEQFDAGLIFDLVPISIGAFYRGLPVSVGDRKSVLNQDALTFLAGINFGHTKVGYTYCYNLSDVVNGVTSGHEISITFLPYKLPTNTQKREYSSVPCPQF